MRSILALLYVLWVSIRHRKEHLAIRRAFEEYVTPAEVDRLVKHTEVAPPQESAAGSKK